MHRGFEIALSEAGHHGSQLDYIEGWTTMKVIGILTNQGQ